MTSADGRLSLPAGEARTGFVLAAVLAGVAQCGIVSRGLVAGWAPLALHCAAAGLAYLLFVNLTKRKVGAPLLAAVLFGAHPLVAPALAAEGGWREPLGTALGFLSGVLLARTPLQPRLLVPSLVAYAVALPLATGVAAIPFLVAAGVVAYHGLDPARLFTKRLLPRFLWFLVPLGAWTLWSALGTDAAPPGFGAAAAFVVIVVAPFSAGASGAAWAGMAICVACAAFGLMRLRAAPKAAWPLLALGASLAAAALMPSATASFTAALAFAALLAGEGIERLFYGFGAVVATPLLVLVYLALAVLSHLAAR